jgi:hypothetical protein
VKWLPIVFVFALCGCKPNQAPDEISAREELLHCTASTNTYSDCDRQRQKVRAVIDATYSPFSAEFLLQALEPHITRPRDSVY